MQVSVLHSLIPCSGRVGRCDTPLHSQWDELFILVVNVFHVFGSNSSSARSVVATLAYRAHAWFYLLYILFSDKQTLDPEHQITGCFSRNVFQSILTYFIMTNVHILNVCAFIARF